MKGFHFKQHQTCDKRIVVGIQRWLAAKNLAATRKRSCLKFFTIYYKKYIVKITESSEKQIRFNNNGKCKVCSTTITTFTEEFHVSHHHLHHVPPWQKSFTTAQNQLLFTSPPIEMRNDLTNINYHDDVAYLQ